MSIKNKIVAAALSGLAIAGIVAGATLSFPQSTSAQTSTPATPTTTTAARPAGATPSAISRGVARTWRKPSASPRPISRPRRPRRGG